MPNPIIRQVTFYLGNRRMWAPALVLSGLQTEKGPDALKGENGQYVSQADLEQWIARGDQVVVTASGKTHGEGDRKTTAQGQDMTVDVLLKVLIRLEDQFTADELHALIRAKVKARLGGDTKGLRL